MRYRHFKGGIYTYICDALSEDNEQHVIVYKDEAGRNWVRAREEFYGKLEFEGEFVQRFVEMEEADES